MASDHQAIFFETAARLDQTVHCDLAILLADDISVSDDSYRGYHYDPLLFWRFQFVARKKRRFEIEKVEVTLTVIEDALEECRIWRRVELFQSGQLSRWHQTDEQVMRVNDLCQQGIAQVVLPLVKDGRQLVGRIA